MEQPPQDAAAAPTTAPAPRQEPTSTSNTAGRPIDKHWDDGTTLDEATMAGSPPQTGDAFGGPEELTEEGRTAPARLVVIAGNDTGRDFPLSPGKPLTIGRAIDNDVVLTDIAVSRKHLDLVWEGGWVLKDRGSGNGTLVNDRIEDGQCRLQHGDRIEIGHTVFRFDHASAAGQPSVGWGTQNDDEASTVAGRQSPRPTMKGPPPVSARGRTASTPPPAPTPRPGLPPPQRVRAPSQSGGAVSSRLALPANSPGEDALGRGEPAYLSAAGLAGASEQLRAEGRHEMRTMTATSHVDPLPYGSGSVAPLHGYPRVPMPTRKIAGISAALLAGFTAIGLIASVTDSDEPPPLPQASASEAAAPAPEPEPAPITVEPRLAVIEPDDRNDVEIDDLAVDPPGAPEPEIQVPPPPVVDAAPAVVEPVEPEVVEPAKVEPVKVEPPEVPPPPRGSDKKVTPKKVDRGITRPDPRKKPEPKKKDPPRIEREPKKAPPPTSLAAAKKKAQSLYASKDFKGAAAAARSAAENAAENDDNADAAALEKLASDYEALATAINAGNAAAASKPTDALAAYKRALATDKRLGGTHSPMIREKLGGVAPKAAAGFMAKGNYEAAKQAADTAVNFGAGSSATVTQVRQSLERKAGEFYANGMKLLGSKPEEGKALLRRVQKIVPPDSPWYIKAYKALNTRSAKARDDDE